MQGLAQWVPRLSSVNLPVLRATAHDLEQARSAKDQVTARELSTLILRDPLMSVKVLRFSQSRLTSRQLTEVTTVEHAIMMHGVDSFFREFQRLLVLEDVLGAQPAALDGALAVVSRSCHAAVNARNFAALRHDIEGEEVMVGALLHDLAELLLWCTEPDTALQVERMLAHTAGLRSAAAQRVVLGFPLSDLQLALAHAWQLPRLLSTLMDDAQWQNPRVQTVRVSVAIARHTAHGWDDAGLPDDYKSLQALLNVAPDVARRWVVTTALQAARQWHAGGTRPAAAWLPLLPGTWPTERAEQAPARAPAIVDVVLEQLDAAVRGIESAAAVAAACYGFEVGLGLRRVWLGRANARTGKVETVHRLFLEAGLAARDLEFEIGCGHLFDLLLERGQAVWHSAARSAKLTALLPPSLRATIGQAGFFAMAVQPAGSLPTLVYADAGAHGRLDDDGYNSFKTICLRLARALEHAVD